jgi:tRNA threonylcarbamoyladenosine biosynthesis protein TsaE
MAKKAVHVSKSIKDTEKIAKIFLDTFLKSKSARSGALVVALSGDLGAGKTAFTKAVAKHLGIRESIKSPTFVIMKKYPVAEQTRYGAGPLKFLFHIDAYRLASEKELLYLGWEDIIAGKEHMIFIEWPEQVPKIIPTDAVLVRISTDKEGNRKLSFK